MNTQEPTKILAVSPGGEPLIQVHSLFPTIQGEGPYAGSRAVFVRLWGCNLQCPLCDTEYTSKKEVLSPRRLVARIVETEAFNFPAGDPALVVVTGGEPFRQSQNALLQLVSLLSDQGYSTQFETNGTLFSAAAAHWASTVICSPKTGAVNPKLLPYIDAYKYVVHADDVDPADLLPRTALDHTAKPKLARPHKRFRGKVYLQPVDTGDPEDNKRHLAAAIQGCKIFGYTLGLQLHKLIGEE